MSHLFGQTLREAPADAEIASHKLLMRSGYIAQLAAGIFSYLPLARRSLHKIENIMRQEMDAIGGEELTMPVIHPAEVWKETGRWEQVGSEMGRFKDKNDRDMVLAMTHEEVVGDLVRKQIHSYRQLPRLIYHIQTKWRDEARPRAGLIRVREFTMKDSYSLDADREGLDRQYRNHYQAYFNIFHRTGLPVIAVKSDVGMMGGQMAHEFMYLNPIGEDTLMICKDCGYSANRQVARFQKPQSDADNPLPVKKVHTPGAKTIEAVAEHLNLPTSKTGKAVFFSIQTAEAPGIDRLVFALVRGDMEVNETKLANAVNAKEMRPATNEEILAAGAVPGFASPMGLKQTLVVVDDLIPAVPNLTVGANEDDYHLSNVNYERDYSADIVTDIAAACAGDACPRCGSPLDAERGVEVGNIFKLGTRYSESMGCKFLDRDGKEKLVIMGSYGIGSGRLLACVAEHHHDEAGLAWPISVAPYAVHMVMLAGAGPDPQVVESASRIYDELRQAGVEVLFDDRTESPGVKFKDADLMGMPIRLTVGKKALARNGIELKLRTAAEAEFVPLPECTRRVTETIAGLETAILKTVQPAPFTE